MEQYKEVVVTNTKKLPTYLLDLLQTQEEIILVYRKKVMLLYKHHVVTTS